MATLRLQTYDMLKQKFGDSEAKLFIEYIETEVAQKVEQDTKQLATKQDLMQTREDLIREIANVQKIIYTVGVIQFLAIVASVIGIISFMMR